MQARGVSPNQHLQAWTERADGPPVVAARGGDFRLGTRETGWHRHRCGQLFCVDAGLVHLRTAHSAWLLPPGRAAWVPPGERHAASLRAAAGGWTVLVAPAFAQSLPGHACVMGVSELLGALVRRVAQWTWARRLDAPQRRAVSVLLDELRRAPQEPPHLPLPADRRLLRIARAVIAAPGDTRSLDAWAAFGGLSARTLTRLSRAELGMSFAQWRRQAGLMHALERLAQGDPVGVVADALGYATPSAFIAMFRRAFGETPARYAARHAGRGP